MSDFIKELRAEHTEVLRMFDAAHRIGVTTPEGGDALKQAHQKLAAHLAKEDERLYPPLQAAARKSDNVLGLEGIIRTMSSEMAAISGVLNEFMDRFSRDPKNPELEGEFHHIYKLLSERINRENDTVFRFYEKLVG